MSPIHRVLNTIINAHDLRGPLRRAQAPTYFVDLQNSEKKDCEQTPIVCTLGLSYLEVIELQVNSLRRQAANDVIVIML